MISYSAKRSVYYTYSPVEVEGFNKIDFPTGAWVTGSDFAALAHEPLLDGSARAKAAPRLSLIEASRATDPVGWFDEESGYLPYQQAAVEHITENLFKIRKTVLIADPPGLGKTVMAAGVIDETRPRNVLVVCPAGLRINWKRELENWVRKAELRMSLVFNGKTSMGRSDNCLVISYDLMKEEMGALRKWDLLILDEAHYLKNPEARRTKVILGNKKKKGVYDEVGKTLLLTGTPIPNRPHEFFHLLKRCASDVLAPEYGSEWAFQKRYTTGYPDPWGWKITGAKNQKELGARLRGTGFMIRREKAAVMPQLPAKRFSLVVFPKNSETAKIIEKEKQFDAKEIAEHGVPVNAAALPELRREMGLAKVRQCCSWIMDQIEEGVEKMVVFAYHRDVLFELEKQLAEYEPLLILGGLSPKVRQAKIDQFQTDEKARILLAQVDTAVGYNAHAAHVVAFVEASWVPGVNDQAWQRTERIGQKSDTIFVYFLVVEESLDAVVLSAAMKKQNDISLTID